MPWSQLAYTRGARAYAGSPYQGHTHGEEHILSDSAAAQQLT